jgi:hypothetical protein
MGEVAEAVGTGQHLETAHLLGGVAEREPGGDDLGLVGLGQGHAGILVPGHAEIAFVLVGALVLRRFRADVVDGVEAELLRADELLQGVEQARGVEEGEEGLAEEGDHVEAVLDLRALRHEQAEAAGEWRLGVEVRDHALGLQCARFLIDPCGEFGAHRGEVGVGEQAVGDQDAIVAEGLDLLRGQGQGGLGFGGCVGGAHGVDHRPPGRVVLGPEGPALVQNTHGWSH